MKLTLDGVEYDATNLINIAPVGYIRELKKISSGLTVGEIRTGFKSLGEKTEVEGFMIPDLLDDDEFTRVLQGFVWLAGRVLAHKPWSWDDAANAATLDVLFSIVDGQDTDDDNEGGDTEDPKALGASAAGDNAAAPETSTTT